ncbi:hypothetical protein AA313_de0210305 [Arthrobotrys entomopaga]|nr:hypothetical protein AA313_de0210305 [Arthrobotrys entomopaga]
MRSINQKSLLRDGACHVYEIPVEATSTGLNLPQLAITSWVIFTWLTLAGMFVGTKAGGDGLELTWVGYANVFGFVGCSILLRLLDRYCMTPVEEKATEPDKPDAVFILGRRNSCFVLKGRRQDVAERTGYGIRHKEGFLTTIAEFIMRSSSLLVILFVFITIPNGTTSDQLAFILVNLLGQANVLILQYLKSVAYFSKLRLVKKLNMRTRTHVYGFLIREFGNGEWVDESGLLPRTSAWDAFRKVVGQYDPDPKDDREIYKSCLPKV